MSLATRLKRLESVASLDEPTMVMIFRWSVEGERNLVRYGNNCIFRQEGEPEDEFLTRAENEVKAMAEPGQRCITVFAEREEGHD